MAGGVDLKDFVAGFLLEAEEHLHSANRNLVATAEALKKGLPEPRAIRELFRSLHTIKGLAAMVGADPIVDIAHEMESLLRAGDKNGGQISERVLDLLVQGTKALEERVRAIPQTGISGIAPASRQLVEALAQAQLGQARTETTGEYEIALSEDILKTLSISDREQVIQGAKAKRHVYMAEFQPSPEKAARGFNITSVREKLSKLGELVKVFPHTSKDSPTGISFCLLMISDASEEVIIESVGGGEHVLTSVAVRAVMAPAKDSETERVIAQEELTEYLPSDQASIRVDVRRLDEALEQLSSLFVTKFKLDRVAASLTASGIDTRDLKAVIAENTRQLRRLRTAISEARMVPLNELLQRVPLVVRGITRNSQKSVNVTIQAGSAEVDKAVADKIFPAVIHLIRNAVDHALETRAERKNAGKPETGELIIVCDDSSGTNLVLTITDDGRGVNREAVARKLSEPVAQNDDELLSQICSAGLSTSEQITHTSGRGMGMDIVRRTVEVLGGSLALQTSEGKGTTITLRVPVTVTIVDVLSFLSGGQVFVAPLAIVDEIVEIDPLLSVNLPMPEHKGVQPQLIQHRGKTIPLFSLDSLLKGSAVSSVARKALIVNRNRGAIAFGVDRMIGQQEAVVRPLDDALVRVTGTAGATDLGDGRPTLVLDLCSLGASVLKNTAVAQQ